jgi:hypothetical protein
MPRQRKQEPQSKRSKSGAEKSASQTSKATGISTKAAETSGDPKDPSLSRRRPASRTTAPSGPAPPAEQEEAAEMDLQNMSRKSQWLILAVGSGACAAFNGVFAKLYVFTFALLGFPASRWTCAYCNSYRLGQFKQKRKRTTFHAV